MSSENVTWPAMTIDEAHAFLTAPGAPFEMETVNIRGIDTRTYKNAPATLRDVFQLSEAWAERDFMVYEDERVTFAAHTKAVKKFATVLTEKYGVKKGDRVALIMRNYPEWSVVFWATVSIGAIIVPLNAWWTGPEMDYGIQDSGSCVVIADGRKLQELEPHVYNLELRGLIGVRCPREKLGRAEAFEDLVGQTSDYAGLDDVDLPNVDLHPDDDMTIFYTSGTTGKPKGALGTHRNVSTNLMSSLLGGARSFMRRGEMPPTPSPDDPQRSMLISVPLFHATGCYSVLVPIVAGGGKLVMMYKWDVEQALPIMEREKVAAFGGVPAIAWQVLESPNFEKYDLSSVESVAYGGAPASPELVRRIKETFPAVQPGQGYGLTETSAITTQNSAEDYMNRPDSAGVAVPVCDLKVVDADGNDLPRGEVGELWIKGPNVVKGYWNKPEATADTFVDGWLKSGDLVRMDEEGFVYILDRAKDMLIRGGENIYCVEVEDALYNHPAVMDAAVVGIPHKVLGEEVGAVVQLSPGQSASVDELQNHVAGQLAAFKVPIAIETQEEPLERNANGKILKPPLRDRMAKYSRG